jgi:hypothetical protein
MTSPADEISTGEVAVLLGISGAMLRRVAGQGYIERHARGKTTVTSAVQGYARFLKDDGARSDANEAQARSHRAKAARIRRETERRRAALTDRGEVEQVIETVAETAESRLRSIDLTGEIDGRTNRKFQAEVKAACQRIKASEASAMIALRGGELDE